MKRIYMFKTSNKVFSRILYVSIFLIFIFSSHLSIAQVNESRPSDSTFQINGSIKNNSSESLENASIENKNQHTLIYSDVDGNFKVFARINDEIIIQLVGYKAQVLKINNKKNLTIIMEANVSTTDNVVVTGYYKRSKESFTGASTTITRKELEKFNNNNLFSIIQSIDPAFKINPNNAQGSNPNALPDISIRGSSGVASASVSTVNTPLIIIDGFQGTLQQLYDMDVNRIESISILKDASATILYGSRAGNGVLVIETRLPKAGDFTVTYEARPSLTLVDLTGYKLLNATQKLEYEKLAGLYNYPVTSETDPYRAADGQQVLNNLYNTKLAAIQSGVNTYWLSQPVHSPLSVAHSIRMEGGNNDVRYSIDGGYNDFKGVMKESGRKQYNAAFNLVYRVQDKFIFRSNSSFISSKAYNSPFGDFSNYTLMNPYEKIRDNNGKLINAYNILGQSNGDIFGGPSTVLYNPLYNAALPFKNYNSSTLINENISFEWFINKNFKLNTTGYLSKSFSDAQVYTSPFSTAFINITDNKLKGSYLISNGNGVNYQANANLQYGTSFGKNTINANGIVELTSNSINNTTYNLTGFVNDKFISPSLALQYYPNSRPIYIDDPSRLLGFASNIHYEYDHKYLGDFSFRRDGSSKFGKENQFGFFWSGGLGYNIFKEKFIERMKFFNLLRVYGNIGVTGNENFSTMMSSTAYTYDPQVLYYQMNGVTYANQGNALLSWPKTRQLDLGLQSAFLENRVNVRFDYYNKLTTNMISQVSVAPSQGFANNSMYQNLGNVTNKGFEFSTSILVYSNARTQTSVKIDFSALKNTSKLSKISNELRSLNALLLDSNFSSTTPYYQEGESLSAFRGVRSLGIDPANGREIYIDKSGNRTYDWNASDMVIIGNAEPKLRGTGGIEIAYKGFTIRGILLYSLGGDIYNQTLVDKLENVSPYTNVDERVLNERWKNPGDVVKYKAIADRSPTYLTSRFVQKENYLRLSSFNINYDVSQAVLKKYKIQRLRFNFSTNDLFNLTNIQMERGTIYPFARTYNTGIMVQF